MDGTRAAIPEIEPRVCGPECELVSHWALWWGGFPVDRWEHPARSAAASAAERLRRSLADEHGFGDLQPHLRYRWATRWAPADEQLWLAAPQEPDPLDEMVLHRLGNGALVLLRADYRLVLAGDNGPAPGPSYPHRSALAQAVATVRQPVWGAEQRYVTCWRDAAST